MPVTAAGTQRISTQYPTSSTATIPIKAVTLRCIFIVATSSSPASR